MYYLHVNEILSCMFDKSFALKLKEAVEDFEFDVKQQKFIWWIPLLY